MINVSRRKLCLAVILLMLFISVTYSLPVAHASESSVEQKGIAVLGNVAAIDLAQYTVTSKQQPQKYPYLNAIQEDVVSYTLKSQDSKLDVSCTFAKGKLHILHVLESEGTPILTKTSASIRDMAQNYLDNYTVYSKESLYTELGTMLNGVDASKNSTVTSGNVKLQVNAAADGYTTFSWIYSLDGVDAAEKCVALGYENDMLKYFVDTWSLHVIGSTVINLSEEEAVAIAIQSARAFSYKVGSDDEEVTVKDLNVTRAMVTQLVFCDSVSAYSIRGDEMLALYPMWRIGVGLDNWYPGNVYGIYVDVWADTGEVRLVQEAFSTLPPEFAGSALFNSSDAETSGSQASDSAVQSNSIQLLLIFASLALGAFATISLWLRVKKSSLHYDLPKPRFSKFTVGLLCLLLLSAVFFVPVSMVTADSKRATVWGCRDYLKTINEKGNQTALAGNIALMSNVGGYYTSNYQGDGTLKSTFLTQIGDSEETYTKAAVVYFDHGIGANKSYPPNYEVEWHYSVYDNSGTQIFDDEIYNETEGKTFFALINTCLSAKIDTGYIQGGFIGYPTPQGMSPTGHAVGMPFAFTHRTVAAKGAGFSTALNISIDGYGNADDGDFCFIGFPRGAASLSQHIDPALPSRLYGMWVYAFFWFALHNDISINSALNAASLMTFNIYFGETKLHTGFNATWNDGQTWWPDCTMAVYGNGNLKLYHPNPTWLEVASLFNFEEGWLEGAVGVNIDGQYAGDTGYSQHLKVLLDLEPGNHTVEVESVHGGIPFMRFDGYPDGMNPITVYVEEGTTTYVTARYSHKKYLTISAGAGGSTNPTPGVYGYTEFSQVPVTANAGSGYDFDHWLLDGGSYTQNPITVNMNSNHTLQAIFVAESCDLTVNVLNQYSETGYVPLYIDDQYVGTTGYTYPVTAGNHKIYVESPFFGGSAYHFFQHYYYDSTYNYDNPMTIPINQDKTITAYYYSTYG